MNKIFSIIIPSYNCGKLISLTLDSIIKQNNDLFECIVVDGLSKDNTVEIVKNYQKKHDNIKYISEKDEGIYDAMNKGIDLAKGSYLYFIGAGDRLADNCLEGVNTELSISNLDFIYGNVICESSNNVKVGYEFTKNEMAIQGICHQAIFYRKEIFEKVGYYNLKYKVFADNALNIKIIGDDTIQKKYCDIDIAYYKGNGVSQNVRDIRYYNDIQSIIQKNLGEKALQSYICSGRYYYDVLLNEDKKELSFIGDEANYNIFCEDINTYINNNNMSEENDYKKLIVNENIIDYKKIDSAKYYIIGFEDEQLREKVKKDVSKIGTVITLPFFRKSNKFINFLDNNFNKNIVLFGASNLGKRVLQYLKYIKRDDLRIISVIDNNEEKQGKIFEGYYVENPRKVLRNFDGDVLVASTWNYDIIKQIKEYKIKNIISVHLA